MGKRHCARADIYVGDISCNAKCKRQRGWNWRERTLKQQPVASIRLAIFMTARCCSTSALHAARWREDYASAARTDILGSYKLHFAWRLRHLNYFVGHAHAIYIIRAEKKEVRANYKLADYVCKAARSINTAWICYAIYSSNFIDGLSASHLVSRGQRLLLKISHPIVFFLCYIIEKSYIDFIFFIVEEKLDHPAAVQITVNQI